MIATDVNFHSCSRLIKSYLLSLHRWSRQCSCSHHTCMRFLLHSRKDTQQCFAIKNLNSHKETTSRPRETLVFGGWGWGVKLRTSVKQQPTRTLTDSHFGSKVTGCRRLMKQLDTIYDHLLKAHSPVNRSGSPQGFSQVQILQNLNTIQNIHILQT